MLPELERVSTRFGDPQSWSARRARSVYADVRAMANRGAAAAHEAAAAATVEVLELDLDWQLRTLRRAVRGLDVSFTAPSLPTLRVAALDKPFQGETLKGWFNDLGSKLETQVTRRLRVALVDGSTAREVARDLVGSDESPGVLAQQSRRSVESVVRTAFNQASTTARDMTFSENADVVDKIVIVATLDSRTTLFCMNADGDVYPVDSGPRPPFHFGCRTTIAPVLKSWKALGIDLEEAPEGTRASMDGQVPESVTYPEWLKEQPNHVQDDALGPERARLFREGKVTIPEFLGKDLKPLTLEELRSSRSRSS